MNDFGMTKAASATTKDPAAKNPAAMLNDLAHRLLGKQPGELGAEERRVWRESRRAPSSVATRPTSPTNDRPSANDCPTGSPRSVGRGASSSLSSFVLLGWMLLNSDILTHFGGAFDPFPYIFLNLILSTVAAIQAPVIMMSQNRQSAKDRLAASLDYETNLRAELDVLRVHEELDHIVPDRLSALEGKIDRLCAALPTG